MSTSAQALIASAPIGGLVSEGDGRPRPPARFKGKLAEWPRFNGIGRLDGVTPVEMRGAHEVSARFVLHGGDFGLHGAIVLTVRRCVDARSPLTLNAVDAAPEAIVGFVTDGVQLELGGVFASESLARAWQAKPRAERAFLAEVQDDRSLRRLAPVLTAIAA